MWILFNSCVFSWTQNEAMTNETPHNPSNQNQNAAQSFELRPMLQTEEQEAGRDRNRRDAAWFSRQITTSSDKQYVLLDIQYEHNQMLKHSALVQRNHKYSLMTLFGAL